ncbi:MAG TPA: helix-hairpin-helix domain-containing protein [Gammaproteobacteria bacterium]
MKRSALSLCCASFALLSASLAWAGPVNINTADAATLAAELDGVGPALAEEIVRDREQNGAFESPEELTRVKGIGPRIVEMNRANILTRDPEKT